MAPLYPQEPLIIRMLGSFSVSVGPQTISSGSVRSRKLWLLFKYIAAHRDRMIPTSELTDELWDGEACENPQRALQNLVYRLRGLLKNSCGDGDYIVFTHNCYTWGEMPCVFDTEEFESKLSQARALIEKEPETAIKLYKEALELYTGDFLPEYPYEKWAVLFRDRYKRLYSSCVDELTGIYSRKGDYPGMEAVCEHALRLDPYSESIHACLIYALIEQGKLPQARAHYESISAQMYRDIGAKPSHELKEAYRRVQESFNDSRQSGREGALLCDADTFRRVYNAEVRRSRADKGPFLVWFCAEGPGAVAAMDLLTEQLCSSLRRNDAVTKRGQDQCLVMMQSLEHKACVHVAARIADRFHSAYDGPEATLKYNILPPGSPPGMPI